MLAKILTHSLPQLDIDESGESTRIVRAGLFFGVLLVAIFLIWGSLAPIHGAVVTDGIVKIDSNRKSIQHLEGGIIKEILVREGSHVEKDQPLLILEDITTSSQLNILEDRYHAGKAKEARLLAQKKHAASVTFPQELTADNSEKTRKLLANEIELFNSRRKNFVDQVNLLNFEITQAQSQINGFRNEMAAIKSGMESIKKQLDASTTLQRKGYVEESKVWEQERLLAEKNERLGSIQADIAAAQANITNTRITIINLENTYTQEADDQLKETQKELLEVQELLRPAKNAQERSAVTAPLAGQVINLKVTTIGGVIRPGEDLMEIVPRQNELIVEAKIKTSDIDNVHIDQLAHIQLTAYNRRTTPMLEGKVTYISGDVLEDMVNRGTYYYLCHIKVDEAALSQLADNIILFPGMPIAAFIQTRARTFIDFLLEPIIDNMRRAFREE
ncbi:HlyD family type I secretion periplasmic adaptor subunit [Methylobacter sp. YRD-M1]|uniref:HlyD family type I secretion periplasmic adaptor subunit n=1 Tax=Methylobacter sp. YRD-M1 TaxID=2911520 RepID=UPI00227A493D|nr:HlyD family type I secretion periplasmic adaptor subunit [Methylobacter sp. YRD-M1]WAK00679.1 HlyD family type I secretion periplasmic adaptor subunit [Methylobacter sp. YRD-M1]